MSEWNGSNEIIDIDGLSCTKEESKHMRGLPREKARKAATVQGRRSWDSVDAGGRR